MEGRDLQGRRARAQLPAFSFFLAAKSASLAHVRALLADQVGDDGPLLASRQQLRQAWALSAEPGGALLCVSLARLLRRHPSGVAGALSEVLALQDAAAATAASEVAALCAEEAGEEGGMASALYAMLPTVPDDGEAWTEVRVDAGGGDVEATLGRRRDDVEATLGRRGGDVEATLGRRSDVHRLFLNVCAWPTEPGSLEKCLNAVRACASDLRGLRLRFSLEGLTPECATALGRLLGSPFDALEELELLVEASVAESKLPIHCRSLLRRLAALVTSAKALTSLSLSGSALRGQHGALAALESAISLHAALQRLQVTPSDGAVDALFAERLSDLMEGSRSLRSLRVEAAGFGETALPALCSGLVCAGALQELEMVGPLCSARGHSAGPLLSVVQAARHALRLRSLRLQRQRMAPQQLAWLLGALPDLPQDVSGDREALQVHVSGAAACESPKGAAEAAEVVQQLRELELPQDLSFVFDLDITTS